MYNEISMETYLNNLEYWIGYIEEHGGLIICDDDTGKPVQMVTADQLPKTNWNYDNKKLKQPDWRTTLMNHYIDIDTAQKLIKREPTDLYTYYKQLHDPEVTLVKGVTGGLYGFDSDLQSKSMAIHLYEFTTAFDIDENKIVYIKIDEN